MNTFYAKLGSGGNGAVWSAKANEAEPVYAIKFLDDELLSLIDDTAVTTAIKIGACNIYHGCVHNMLYEKSEEILRGLYKSAAFVVRAIAFKQTGKYISHQKDLLEIVSVDE